MLSGARRNNDIFYALRRLKYCESYYVRLCVFLAYWLTSSTQTVVYKNPHYSENKENPDEIDIYCVHGAADRNASLSPWIERMLKKGLSTKIKSIYAVEYEGRRWALGFEFFVWQLLYQILANKNPRVKHPRVILLGHSCGGIECAYLSEFFAKIAGIKVELVIPVCSPFFGTGIAKPLSLFSTSMKQIIPNNPFLQELHKKMSVSETEYFYISAGKDRMVPPNGCCIPEHRHRLKIFPKANHLSSLFEPEVADFLHFLCNQTAEGKLKALISPAPLKSKL